MFGGLTTLFYKSAVAGHSFGFRPGGPFGAVKPGANESGVEPAALQRTPVFNRVFSEVQGYSIYPLHPQELPDLVDGHAFAGRNAQFLQGVDVEVLDRRGQGRTLVTVTHH